MAAIAKLTTSGGILSEPVSGNDLPQFKGIFVRNLVALYQAAPNAKYKTFVDVNADSIWVNDQGRNYE